MNFPVSRKGFLASLGSLVFAPWRPASAEAAIERSVSPKRYLLNRFFVAGLQYHQGVALVANGRIHSGDFVRLSAEPENPHDDFAVVIHHAASGIKLGYVPRTQNNHLSRLLMQDAVLEGKVVHADPEADSWEAVEVEVSLAG